MARYEPEGLFTRTVRVSMQTLAVAIPLMLVAHGPVHAATTQVSACGSSYTSTLDRRLVAKADQGVGELRRFVQRTQPAFQIDMDHAVQRIEHQRAADAACTANVASR